MAIVSVLMPAYNCERFIGEAIESVLNQTFTNFELVIIDDCSTDGTWDVILSYAKKDARIKAFQNEKNLKIVKTRNRLFDLASGKYYAIFDADDVMVPTRLEEQVAFLKRYKNYGAVGSSTVIIDGNSRKIGFRKYPCSNSDIRKKIFKFNPFAQPSMMVRASVIDDVGVYRKEGFDRARDYDLWLRIFEKNKMYNFEKPLLKYRVSKTQGKKTHLKETLRSTVALKKKWVVRKGTFSDVLYLFLERILLLFPERFVLWLFKKVRYSKKSL